MLGPELNNGPKRGPLCPHLTLVHLDEAHSIHPLVKGNITASMCTKSTHYDDVIMGAMASQITSLTIVYSTVYSGADQGKHQSSAGTGEFPAQMASNAENVSIWWRHHASTDHRCSASYAIILQFWYIIMLIKTGTHFMYCTPTQYRKYAILLELFCFQRGKKYDYQNETNHVRSNGIVILLKFLSTIQLLW